MDSGQNPIAEREDGREASRFPDLVERYLREHAAHLAPRNAADQESMLRKLIEPHWKHRRVTEIAPADIERVLNLIAQGRSRPAKKKTKAKRSKPPAPPKPTPIRANRAGEMLRKVFYLAIAWKIRTDNPALGFRRQTEVERERFLSMEEIARLGDALAAAEDRRAAAIIRMCMLTGARVGEVRTAL
ncbi:Phage integrase, N-terminal SAM-like domain [Paracoccus halophilus]|uniref:Phage integrase, N-terminal SAM-like domain n=1 Tax=Paracoccus halophilus TaxID=376733 RepID=A0A1I0U943_9RHOB|nr:Phage integrase, N-terminal SAM-like domain [Paracoccus halophilus]